MTLARRLAAMEARRPPARPPAPPLDLIRLDPPERGELEGLAARVTRAGGRVDFADLDDDDLFRLGALVRRAAAP